MLAGLLAVVHGLAFAADYSGTVKWNGLPLPGATVTATDGTRRLVTTAAEDGRYALSPLTPGTWVFEVEMFGFAKARREVAVTGDGGTLDWTLEIPARAATPAPKSTAPTQRPARPQAAQRTGATGQQPAGFAQVGVSQTTDQELLRALSQPLDVSQIDPTLSSSESFLVTGSLNQGLQLSSQEEAFMMMRAGMGPGGFGPGGLFPGPGLAGIPGMQGTTGGLGEPGAGVEGMDPQRAEMLREGMAAGGPGPGGGPGMRGGPRGGGPGRGAGMGPGMGGGFGGGRGGFGGPEGRGGPGGRGGLGGRRPGAVQAAFGNRANRGRDALRGGVQFSLRDSALDARPYSLTGQTLPKASYSQIRYNLTIGGTLNIPKLVKDPQTFFFLNYSGTQARNPFDATANVPTAAERSGNLAASPGLGALGIHDPLGRLPFPGNVIPGSRIDPASAGLLNYIPLPNQPGLIQNYQLLTSADRDNSALSARGGRSLGSNDRLAGSYSVRFSNGTNVQPFLFLDDTSGRGQNADLSWTHTFRRGLINTARVTFNRNRNDLLPYFANGTNVAAELGIQGTSSDPLNYGPPNLSFTNYGALTDGSPSLRTDQSTAFSDSLVWVRGNKTLLLGGDYRRSLNNTRTDQNGRGSFVFSGLGTSAFDANGQPLAGSGLDFADFLLGLPQSASIRYGSSDIYLRGSSYSLFLQNDWRVTSNLSFNLGLRYEYQSPLYEKYDRMANLDIAPAFTGAVVVTPDLRGDYSGEFPRGLIDPDRNNVGPRFAFAWRPVPKRSRLLLRGGYGVYYNTAIYAQAAGRLAQQPPFARTSQLLTSVNQALTIRSGFLEQGTTETITNTYAVDRSYRAGYAQTWSFSAQQELPASLSMEIGYLGTKGTRLDIQRLPNRAAPGSVLTAEQQRLIGNAVGFTFDSSEGNSIYHAAQVRVTRRFRRGLAFNAQYTWAKSIDNASTFGGGGASVVQDDRNLAAERGLSSFDRRHTLNYSWTYSSPFGNSASVLPMNGWAGRLLRNWSLTGGLSVQSGSPFTARVLGNRSDAGGTGAVGSGRANATGLPVNTGIGFFNLLAFTVPAADQYGNASRNTIPGPAAVSLNASVGRLFPFGERRTLDIRAESNNLTNRVTYSRFGTTVNASDYGIATGVGQMRSVQLNVRFRF